MRYFVTVGTQPHQFTRLIGYVEECINKNDVIIQSGHTKVVSEFAYFQFCDDFEQKIIDCDIVITHGGVGSIISALKHQKKVIAVARKLEFSEHVDDHQMEIVDKLAINNYILKADTLEEFEKCIREINNIELNQYSCNNKEFNKKLIEELDV